MARRDPLAGPGMGYGLQQRPTAPGITVPTLVLGVVCVLLAVALALALVGRRAALTAVPAATVTVTAAATADPASSPTPTATTAATVAGTAATFVRAWHDPNPATRAALLHQVAADTLAAQLIAVPTAKIPRTTPVGTPAVTMAGDTAATATQPLSDHTTMTMQLGFDASAQTGWVVTAARLG